jgi:hypothetical protein
MNPEAGILLIASSARVVSPGGAGNLMSKRSWFVDWVVGNDSKWARHGAGGFGLALVSGSHGELGDDFACIYNKRVPQMALPGVLLQVYRDRRAGGMLQLSRAYEVSEVARPAIGDCHLANATGVSKMWGGHAGEWGASGRVEELIPEAGLEILGAAGICRVVPSTSVIMSL